MKSANDGQDFFDTNNAEFEAVARFSFDYSKTKSVLVLDGAKNLEKHIEEIIAAFKSAERFGYEKDEPEGARYVMLSDTLCNVLVSTLEKIKEEYGIK